jgi:hypothetical protein
MGRALLCCIASGIGLGSLLVAGCESVRGELPAIDTPVSRMMSPEEVRAAAQTLERALERAREEHVVASNEPDNRP